MKVIAVGITMIGVALASSAHAQQTTTVVETQTTRTPVTQDVPATQKSFLNRPVLLTSTAVLLAGYVPAAVAGGLSDRDEDKNLYIPVAGPWLDLGQRSCSPQQPCGNEDQNKALIIGSGIVQGIGALGVISSFFIPEVRQTKVVAQKASVTVVPARFGTAGYGMSALGKF
jgi:hypothetical protein